MRKGFNRLQRERDTVTVMISLYCHSKHATRGRICLECLDLLNYAHRRLERCPFQQGKTTCARCRVHCYEPEKRERIRVVMRYSGLRMIYQHPILAILHFIDGRRKFPISNTGKKY